MGKSKDAFDRLYEVALDQQGYFTAKQAVAAGYADNVHPFHVKAGNWVRERRGIYRLAKFPPTERPDLMLWSLWSRGRDDRPRGVFSHETALSFYELSDVNPARLHMTVPPGFRKGTPIPKGLALHRARVHESEVQDVLGVKVTTPLRTLADMVEEGIVQKDHQEQAVKEAFARGLVTNAQLSDAARIPENVKREIVRLRDKPRG